MGIRQLQRDGPKLSIIKDGYKYFVRPIHENRDEIWNTGEIVATIESAASDEQLHEMAGVEKCIFGKETIELSKTIR